MKEIVPIEKIWEGSLDLIVLIIYFTSSSSQRKTHVPKI
jgi:hypothetical protein